MNREIEEFSNLCKESVKAGSLKSITFHSPRKRDSERLKVKGTLKHISGKTVLQLEYFLTEGRVKHINTTYDSVPSYVDKLVPGEFKRADLIDAGGDASLMISSKGKTTFIVHGKPGEHTCGVTNENDRRKKRVLTGEERFLVELGISDKSERIHDKKQAKFRQINRFCEYIVEASERIPEGEILRVCDLCCGKSYLSFAAYYTLSVALNRKTEMYCVDLKQSVIDYCRVIAEKSDFNGMHFICGDINEFLPKEKIDMVISLHACDTATDAVLDFAAKVGACVILATPCCHRDLSKKLDCDSLNFIAKIPILRQKLCSAATDALRLLKLESLGYETDATELVDPDDTPKNIMLRAYKRKGFSEKLKEAKRKEYVAAYKLLYGSPPQTDDS